MPPFNSGPIGRRCSDVPAQTVADAIAAAGGLEPAVALAAHDDRCGLLAALLALRAEAEEEADPKLRVARLRTRAAALDDRAERLFEQAAEFFGKAAFRRLRDEGDLGDVFSRRAEAFEAGGVDLAEQACDLRLEAGMLEGRLARAAGIAVIAA